MPSKRSGNLTFMLVAPLSPWEILAAYAAAAARAFVAFPMEHPLAVAGFALLGGALLGALGLLAAVRAARFDGLAALQNLVVVPMTFLSGVFYAVESLPSPWRAPWSATRAFVRELALPPSAARRAFAT